MKSLRFLFLGMVLLLAACTTTDPALSTTKNDGVSSLPVFEGPFPDTNNMVFLSQISPEDLGALPVPGVWAKGMMNDLWGWTSPNGEEYALAPNSGGIAIVRVTDPSLPEYLGRIESQNPSDFGNIWGDPATFGNYAYFVTEIDGSGIVIVDLSGLDALPGVTDPFADLPAPINIVAPGGYDGSHNIHINEDSGFAYLAGVHLQAGAGNNACGVDEPARFNTLILDLNADPFDPTVAACFGDLGEHDFYVVNYTGPDADHQGKEIAFVFDGRDRENPVGSRVGGYTYILDVTDKASVVVLSRFLVPGMVFSHNGWTTAEQDFLFIGDEIDELVYANWSFASFFGQPLDDPTIMPRTGTYVIDIRDLDNPVLQERYQDATIGIDHNFVVEGNHLIIASYTSGTRVLEVGRDANNDIVLAPIAHMDTEPRLPGQILNIHQEERFGSAFLGQWGVYAFPDSDTIIASDINNGLIVMRISDAPCRGIGCSR